MCIPGMSLLVFLPALASQLGLARERIPACADATPSRSRCARQDIAVERAWLFGTCAQCKEAESTGLF
jgi:hypothetical protein